MDWWSDPSEFHGTTGECAGKLTVWTSNASRDVIALGMILPVWPLAHFALRTECGFGKIDRPLQSERSAGRTLRDKKKAVKRKEEGRMVKYMRY